MFTGVLGRDMTLTGRTDIWKYVLAEDINPLLGTGFYSFWLGDRGDRLSETAGFPLNEAHNGYLETYLNSGLIGLALLIFLLISMTKSVQRQLVTRPETAVVRLAFLISIIIYNFTESTFNRLDIIWFALLLVLTEHSPRRVAEPVVTGKEVRRRMATAESRPVPVG
jgi:O-antigen ligase